MTLVVRNSLVVFVTVCLGSMCREMGCKLYLEMGII